MRWIQLDRLGIAIVTLMFVTMSIAVAQASSGCNPEMPRYAEWSASQHFPAHLSADKEKTRTSSLAELTLGMDRERIMSIVGAPDYVGDGSLEPNAIGCMWIYNFSDEAPATKPQDQSLVLLGFAADGKLVMLIPNKVAGIQTLQVTNKTCESKRIAPESRLARDLAAGKTYLASNERQEQVRSGYNRLSLGMSIDQAESLLGAPDAIHVTSHGHPSDAVFVGEPCKRQLEYILRQSSNNPIDPDTAAIYLTFDDQGRLFWGAPQNMEGLKTMGLPAQ